MERDGDAVLERQHPRVVRHENRAVDLAERLEAREVHQRGIHDAHVPADSGEPREGAAEGGEQRVALDQDVAVDRPQHAVVRLARGELVGEDAGDGEAPGDASASRDVRPVHADVKASFAHSRHLRAEAGVEALEPVRERRGIVAAAWAGEEEHL